MNKLFGSAILGSVLLVLSACGSPGAVADETETPSGGGASTATYAASPETQAEIGVANWVLHGTEDSAVLEAQDASGTVTDRASLHWTDTADGRSVDILFQNAHVQYKQTGDGSIAESGLDAFQKLPGAVAFATRAAADLPQAPADSGLSTTSTLNPLAPPNITHDVQPLAGGCHQLSLSMQRCMQSLYDMGFRIKVKATCLSLCNAGN